MAIVELGVVWSTTSTSLEGEAAWSVLGRGVLMMVTEATWSKLVRKSSSATDPDNPYLPNL